MREMTRLRETLDGELLMEGDVGYDDARRPAGAPHRDVHPLAVIRCRSVDDVVRSVRAAAEVGAHLAPRGGGHCFIGSSSTDGVVLDMSGLAGIEVAHDGTAAIGAGARLGGVYSALQAHGRTLPAGCGRTVGIAGLTLGGGIGLLGRAHGLTCDSLVSAVVVLPGGRVVQCDETHEPELFWALRGAGGGRFGVIASLVFSTLAEPEAIPIDIELPEADLPALVVAWQVRAPDAPPGLTVDLTVESSPAGVTARLFGASLLPASDTFEHLRTLLATAGCADVRESPLAAPARFHRLKQSLAERDADDGSAVRIRSEFFATRMSHGLIVDLLDALAHPSQTSRRLTFTAMGGAYDRTPPEATAFAHRGQRFLLEHVGDVGDDDWIDDSWSIAHAEGSGRVYPNFPDAALADPATAYHAQNAERIAEAEAAYDPHGLFRSPTPDTPKERS